jgi:hypothetical protein
VEVDQFDVTEFSGPIDQGFDQRLRSGGDAVDENTIAGFNGLDRLGGGERTFHIIQILLCDDAALTAAICERCVSLLQYKI